MQNQVLMRNNSVKMRNNVDLFLILFRILFRNKAFMYKCTGKLNSPQERKFTVL